jgi:hypothetical protein
MKNVKIDYVPRWAMYMEETRWLNSIKAKAAKVAKGLLLFFKPCHVLLMCSCYLAAFP